MRKEIRRYLTLPNVLTFTNLLFGIFAILISQSTNNHRYLWGFIFIIIAALFDFLDGWTARRLNQVSEFGKELDSLSDIISFGLAPSIIFFNIYQELDWISITLAIILYVFASGYRLARFNISTESNNIIQGLPITIAALILALKNLVDIVGDRDIYSSWRENLILFIVLSILMMSRFKIKKYK